MENSSFIAAMMEKIRLRIVFLCNLGLNLRRPRMINDQSLETEDPCLKFFLGEMFVVVPYFGYDEPFGAWGGT